MADTKDTDDARWMEAVERWRRLPLEERLRRQLEAIPRRVANSMAMEGEPVDEALIREYLATQIQERLARLNQPPEKS